MDYKRRDASLYSRLKDYRFFDGDKTKTCPHCGGIINPFFVICPVCDFDFRDLESYELCKNCGRIIDEDDEMCPACGVTLKPHESLPEVVDLCDEGFRHIRNFKIKEAKLCFNRASKLSFVSGILNSVFVIKYQFSKMPDPKNKSADLVQEKTLVSKSTHTYTSEGIYTPKYLFFK